MTTTTFINGFHQDDEGHWVAELACGHTQHVRHRPPWQNREWTQTEAGRAGRVGQRIDCPFHEMPTLPADAREYRRTDTFAETTIPPGLLRSHRMKPDVWGRIVVERGRLEYWLEEPVIGFVLDEQRAGIVEPGVPHHVTAPGSVRFHVEFLRVEAVPDDSAP